MLKGKMDGIEAAEQSGRTIIPKLFWQTKLNRIDARGLKLALHPEAPQPWTQARDQISKYGDITIAIGPEGGWVDFEAEKFIEQGFTVFSAGPRVLRVDSAVPALLAQISLLRNL